MGDFLFFYPVSRFFNPPFFVACFLMPVVFAAYETDVIEHSWSGEETMRGEERTSRCFTARPLSSIHPTHKANPPIAHTHRQKSTHNAAHYGPPDMWKQGKQRWRAWWRSVRSCGWWRCKARSRTWEGTEKGRKREGEKKGEKEDRREEKKDGIRM